MLGRREKKERWSLLQSVPCITLKRLGGVSAVNDMLSTKSMQKADLNETGLKNKDQNTRVLTQMSLN
jgi:hypothetical protein